VIQSAVESVVDYSYLVLGWGDPLLLNGTSSVFIILSDLQPLFDALRKDFLTSQRIAIANCPFPSSCSICTVLFHVEDMDLLCGC
jgi:hypothetical protein